MDGGMEEGSEGGECARDREGAKVSVKEGDFERDSEIEPKIQTDQQLPCP